MSKRGKEEAEGSVGSRWHLYLIRTQEGHLYTGIATDVSRRFAEHQEGEGSRYLRGRGPLRLVFHTEIGSRSLALRAERRIKGLSKARKEQIFFSGLTACELLTRVGLGPDQG